MNLNDQYKFKKQKMKFLLEKVEEAIRNTKDDTARRPDGIVSEMIKAGGKPMAKFLTKIFNKCPVNSEILKA